MKKRMLKKKIRRRYNDGIKLLVNYCELPKRTVVKEVGKELMEIASMMNEDHNELTPYLDSISLELMWKYGTGWAGKEKWGTK